MNHFQHFEVHLTDDCTLLHLNDTSYFDIRQLIEIQRELLGFVDMYRPEKLVVNFDRIRYCSTALITGVIQARDHLRSFGGELKLCGMSPSVRDAFVMLNLDGTIFEIHPQSTEALAAF